MSQGETALYQERVARFAFVLAGLGLSFLVFRTIVLAILGRPVVDPSMILHGLAGMAMLWTWLLTRSGSRSFRFVGAVETVGLTSGASVPERLVTRVCDWFRARGVLEILTQEAEREDVSFRLPPLPPRSGRIAAA